MINQSFLVVETQFICLEMKKIGRQRPINYATLHGQGVLSNQEICSSFAPGTGCVLFAVAGSGIRG